jgi:hypothetical protein
MVMNLRVPKKCLEILEGLYNWERVTARGLSKQQRAGADHELLMGLKSGARDACLLWGCPLLLLLLLS